MGFCTRTFAAVAVVAAACSAVAIAGPNNPVIVGGTANVTTAGTTTTITQSSQNAVINWQTFNLAVGEIANFNQPNINSITLNRVVGGQGPSYLNGTLTANGRVFIINGDGILIGRGAVINTAGFLASTNDVCHANDAACNQAFATNYSGHYNFNVPGRADASIVNRGTITAASGGFAALVAPGVRNSGTITATLGTVTLAASNSFTLDFYGDRLITLAVDDQIAGQVLDVRTGKPLKSLVDNKGTLSADGGRVELTAAAARAVVNSVINNTGVIEANSIGAKNGMIVLGASTGGRHLPTQTVKVSGKISAAGKDPGTAGGTVVVTGQNIELKGAKIDASGTKGGGKVLIGGDVGGGQSDPAAAGIAQAKLEPFRIPSATTLSVDAKTVINASATEQGNGGKIVLWSDQGTNFDGTILARGGPAGGDGGFAEVSSGGQLRFTGGVNLSAPNGTTGTLLLDPSDVIICGGKDCGSRDYNSDGGNSRDGSPSYLDANVLARALAHANVVVASSGGGSSHDDNGGNINVDANLRWLSNNTLTLAAYGNINIAAGVTIANGDWDHVAAGNLVLRADDTGRGVGTVSFLSSHHGDDEDTVAVIDSQIDVKHPDLEGVIADSFDAVGAVEAPHPHGTGMAGAIASHRRLMGIAPQARIFAVHAFSTGAATAESTTFSILKGLDWAASKGVRVINMSFAGPRDPSIERALKNAHDHGIVLLAAAGNAGPKSPPLYPGADPNVIAVTATDVNDKIFAGANRGAYIAVAAPGVDILVPAPDGSYQLTTGTSVASAEVSGVVALLLERNPKLNPEDVRTILTSSARKLGVATDFGSGLVNPLRAVATAGDFVASEVTTATVPPAPPPGPAPKPSAKPVAPDPKRTTGPRPASVAPSR